MPKADDCSFGLSCPVAFVKHLYGTMLQVLPPFINSRIIHVMRMYDALSLFPSKTVNGWVAPGLQGAQGFKKHLIKE